MCRHCGCTIAPPPTLYDDTISHGNNGAIEDELFAKPMQMPYGNGYHVTNSAGSDAIDALWPGEELLPYDDVPFAVVEDDYDTYDYLDEPWHEDDFADDFDVEGHRNWRQMGIVPYDPKYHCDYPLQVIAQYFGYADEFAMTAALGLSDPAEIYLIA